MKTPLRRLLTIGLATLTSIVVGSSANAWDPDVHTQGPYQLARRMGFNDKFAQYLGAWPDTSAISGPFLFDRARSRFHFNGQKPLALLNDEGEMNYGKIVDISQPDVSTPDAMFMHYIRLGDWQTALMFIHVAMDKLPHSKFISQLGHPEGHDPDRFWRTPEKFEGSILQLARMLAALKTIMPPEYIDQAHARKFTQHGTDEETNDPELVATLFLKDIEHIYKKDYLKDPRYVKAGVQDLFERV